MDSELKPMIGCAEIPATVKAGGIWLVIYEYRLRIIEITNDYEFVGPNEIPVKKDRLVFFEWGNEQPWSIKDIDRWITEIDIDKMVKLWEEQNKPLNIVECIISNWKI